MVYALGFSRLYEGPYLSKLGIWTSTSKVVLSEEN